MADQLLAAGDRCFADEAFDEAVEKYSEALKLEPQSAKLYSARANAQLKLEQYLEAAQDAGKAIDLDPSLASAYVRKGTALFRLEEYEAALETFEAGAKADPSNGTLKTWVRKCQAELEEEKGASRPSKLAPAAAAAAAAPSAPASTARSADTEPAAPAPAAAPAASTSAAAPLAPAAPPAQAGRYRQQWYQLADRVTVDIYAKGLSAGQVTSRFEPHHVTVAIADPSGGQEEYKLDVDTYGPIVPEGCRVEVLKTKVEVVLAKGDNKQWATLEKSDKVAAAAYAAPAPAAAADAGAAASSSASAGGQRPQYPTSHRKAKNWDEVEKEVKELEASGQLEDGDPLNNFFKKIFSQGDDDQRRAMMKSFVESNGTVLSTNWSEVGSKKVECTPPENAVVKKWNE